MGASHAAAPVICAPSLRGAEKEDIDRLIDTVQPDAILHTAASTSSKRFVPEYLAKAANGAKLVLFIDLTAAQRAISRLRKTTLRPQISTPKRSWKWKTAFSRSTRMPSCCVRKRFGAGVFSQSRKRCEARVVQLRSGVQRRKGDKLFTEDDVATGDAEEKLKWKPRSRDRRRHADVDV